jgi:hypothetical protein
MLMYVDDPVYAAVGTSQDVTLIFALALLWAAAVGFPLAWHKADGGQSVAWIGASFTLASEGVQVSIPPDKITTIRAQLTKVLEQPLISNKHIRALAGVLAWVATIVPHIKPFIAEFWATIARSTGKLPVPTKYLKISASWLDAFLRGQDGGVIILHRWDSSERRSRVRICTDASPYGMGGILLLDGHPRRYFAEDITDLDRHRFSAKRDDPSFISVGSPGNSDCTLALAGDVSAVNPD